MGPPWARWEKARQDFRPHTRPSIRGAPVLLVAGAGQIVQKLLAGDAGSILPDLLTLDLPCDFGQGRKHRPYRTAVRSDGEIEVEEHLLDPYAIGILKRPLEDGFGNLKADKGFVGIRGVALLGGLKHVESELCLGVRERIVGIRDPLSEFQFQLRVQHGHRHIHGHAMAVIVTGVMRQRPQRECILVEVLRLSNQVQYEVAAADVMSQIAVKRAAERIISQILNDASAVGIGVRLSQLIRGRGGKSLQEQRLYGTIPSGIDNGFVGENGVR